MLTVEQVKNNISNYKIENGIVIDKSNNQPVQDEDKILEVKSSVMMYREAKSLYDKRLRGAPDDQETYINKALKVYGLNDEVNDYPQNDIKSDDEKTVSCTGSGVRRFDAGRGGGQSGICPFFQPDLCAL